MNRCIVRATATGRWEADACAAVSGTNEGADDSVFYDETVNGMFGSNSVWYEWRAPVDGPVTFETSGSDFDTMLAAYKGDPAVQIARNDDASAYYGLAWSQGAEDDPPQTTIVSGPSGSSPGGSATLTFESSESGSTFQCALNGGPWQACASPVSYAALTEGAYTFYVRASDASANTDPSPATLAWTVP
jgi:hypothetical protein